MTDSPAPLSDEDLSAIIDGEADADVVARFQRDATARARVKELQAASDLLRTSLVTPLPSASIDQLIGNALDAMGTEAGETAAPTGAPTPSTSSDTSNVVAFAGPKPRRVGPSPWLVAAAVVILAGIGITMVWGGARSHDEKSNGNANTELAGPVARSTTTVESSDSASATPDRSEASQPGSGATDAESTPTAEPTVDLGTFADSTALKTSLAKGVPADARTAVNAPSADTTLRCSGQVLNLFPNMGLAEAPTTNAVATVDGTKRFVFVFEIVDHPSDIPKTMTQFVVVTQSLDVCEPADAFVR